MRPIVCLFSFSNTMYTFHGTSFTSNCEYQHEKYALMSVVKSYLGFKGDRPKETELLLVTFSETEDWSVSSTFYAAIKIDYIGTWPLGCPGAQGKSSSKRNWCSSIEQEHDTRSQNYRSFAKRTTQTLSKTAN